MAVSPSVLAEAKKPHNRVIIVTNGTSALGQLICEQAIATGANVYALDADPTALAQLAIRFRKKELTLRVVPCELKNQVSIEDAIDEITNHSPPIDLWIHSEVLTPSNIDHLSSPLITLSRHFSYNGRRKARFISDINPESQTAASTYINNSPLPQVADVVIATYSEHYQEIVDQVLRLKA